MNQIKTAALLGLLSALLITVSYWVIGGSGGAIIGIGLAAAMNLGSWFYSDKIALAAYGAVPITASQAPGLYTMVERLAQRANLPMPGVYQKFGFKAPSFQDGFSSVNALRASCANSHQLSGLTQSLQRRVWGRGSVAALDQRGVAEVPVVLESSP